MEGRDGSRHSPEAHGRARGLCGHRRVPCIRRRGFHHRPDLFGRRRHEHDLTSRCRKIRHPATPLPISARVIAKLSVRSSTTCPARAWSFASPNGTPITTTPPIASTDRQTILQGYYVTRRKEE